ncbi:MAG: hypothetical protein WBL05_12920 [Brooklawnia sp.]|uniref:hypothetical protein n=1 Tax=Brooklawnia sp. TaxID=2699740 RepID=UPI003C78CBFD
MPSGTDSRWRRRRSVGLLLVLIVLINLAVNPWLARYRSLIVMSGYDWWFERKSLAHDAGVHVSMPLADGGLYPRLITYNSDAAMSGWLDAPVRFTVDFSFGDFAPWQGHSVIFDPADELYGSYVGAYYLQGLAGPLTTRQVELVAEFDQRVLALPALGLAAADAEFEVLARSGGQSVAFAGRQWVSHEARLRTNCPDHSPGGFSVTDLQFGRPPATAAHYPSCEMAARIDVTYLPEPDLTIGLFIMAASTETVDRLSDQVVRRAELVER